MNCRLRLLSNDDQKPDSLTTERRIKKLRNCSLVYTPHNLCHATNPTHYQYESTQSANQISQLRATHLIQLRPIACHPPVQLRATHPLLDFPLDWRPRRAHLRPESLVPSDCERPTPPAIVGTAPGAENERPSHSCPRPRFSSHSKLWLVPTGTLQAPAEMWLVRTGTFFVLLSIEQEWCAIGATHPTGYLWKPSFFDFPKKQKGTAAELIDLPPFFSVPSCSNFGPFGSFSSSRRATHLPRRATHLTSVVEGCCSAGFIHRLETSTGPKCVRNCIPPTRPAAHMLGALCHFRTMRATHVSRFMSHFVSMRTTHLVSMRTTHLARFTSPGARGAFATAALPDGS